MYIWRSLLFGSEVRLAFQVSLFFYQKNKNSDASKQSAEKVQKHQKRKNIESSDADKQDEALNKKVYIFRYTLWEILDS